jgi:hypothetical protein
VNIYDYHKWRKSLPALRGQGLVLLGTIFDKYLEKTGDQRDEENINYVEMINDIMIGPMEKHGTTWEDVLIEIDDWNQNVGTGDVEDEFHHINKDLFRDTLYKYWGKKI